MKDQHNQSTSSPNANPEAPPAPTGPPAAEEGADKRRVRMRCGKCGHIHRGMVPSSVRRFTVNCNNCGAPMKFDLGRTGGGSDKSTVATEAGSLRPENAPAEPPKRPVRFTCGSCGKVNEIRVPITGARVRVNCKHCSQVVQLNLGPQPAGPAISRRPQGNREPVPQPSPAEAQGTPDPEAKPSPPVPKPQPAAEPPKQWNVRIGGEGAKIQGPFPENQIRVWIKEGKIKPGHFVRCEPGDWLQAGKEPAFEALFPQTASPPARQAGPAAPMEKAKQEPPAPNPAPEPALPAKTPPPTVQAEEAEDAPEEEWADTAILDDPSETVKPYTAEELEGEQARQAGQTRGATEEDVASLEGEAAARAAVPPAGKPEVAPGPAEPNVNPAIPDTVEAKSPEPEAAGDDTRQETGGTPEERPSGTGTSSAPQIAPEIANARQPPATSKKRCFIATAAFGTPYAPVIDEYRQFRDQVLSATRTGRLTIRLYDIVGPPAAAVIRRSPRLRRHVCWGLEISVPLVRRFSR